MTLHCNVISYWLGAYTKWSLIMIAAPCWAAHIVFPITLMPYSSETTCHPLLQKWVQPLRMSYKTWCCTLKWCLHKPSGDLDCGRCMNRNKCIYCTMNYCSISFIDIHKSINFIQVGFMFLRAVTWVWLSPVDKCVAWGGSLLHVAVCDPTWSCQHQLVTSLPS